MKITFSNLGAIKKTTLDLRPLTVIIGPNNSNKTYIAYSIYGLWQSNKIFSSFNSEFISFLKFFVVNDETSSDNERESTLSLENVEFIDNLVEFVNKSVESRIKTFLFEISEYFQDSNLKIFSQTDFDLEITKEDLLNIISNLRIKEFKAESSTGMNPRIYSTLRVKNKQVTIESKSQYLNDDLSSPYSILFGNFVEYIISSMFSSFLLPAERNSFIITYKMLENRRYRFMRENQRHFFSKPSNIRHLDLLKEQGDIRYPQPIEDFLDFLTDVELETNIDIDSEDKKKFYQLAGEIEKNIQEKNKTNFKSTKFGGKEIKINVKRGLDIDLYNASSSIKQLAPLLLYLRYRAKDNDLLIIDEPEMNLHPESQAKFLEVLGMLVNSGVNVLLTTHSPYFMSHLNNLIAGDMTNDETREKQAKSLYLEDARAFLKPEDVSAYEMRKDKTGKYQELYDLHDKDYGIRWDTLSDVSAEIQQKFFEIYEQKENSSNGEEEN